MIPEHILNQFKFWVQIEKAQRRKLISRIANTELLSNEEAVKEDLIISVFQRLQDEIQFSESIDSNLLIDIIKDLSSSYNALTGVFDKSISFIFRRDRRMTRKPMVFYSFGPPRGPQPRTAEG